jgi:hypothetical protein
MADKLTSGQTPLPAYQEDVISKTIRDYGTNVKNKINEMIDEWNAAQIGTTNAETTAARPYHTNLKQRLDSIEKGSPDYTRYGGIGSESTPNAMTVDVTAGEAVINGIDVKWAAQTSGVITAPVTNPRIDVVVANTDSTVTVVTGSEAVSPVSPTIADTQITLFRIDMYVGMATITNSDITDLKIGASAVDMFMNIDNVYEDITYDSDNNIDTVEYRMGGSDGHIIATATYTYSGVFVTSVSTVYDSVTYVTTYTYDSDKLITNIVTTRS